VNAFHFVLNSRFCRRVQLLAAVVLVWTQAPAFAADPPIIVAARNGDLESVKRILESNPKAANMTCIDHETALHAVCRPSRDRICVQSNLQFSAKALADQNPIAKILIEHGADVNAKDAFGDTPLLEAIESDDSSLAMFLIQNRADVTQTSSIALSGEKFTALHLAARREHFCPELIMLLVANRAKINAQTNFGNTPLHLAAIYNRPEVAKLLLQSGADVTIINKSGQTPLDAARAAGNEDVVKVLSAIAEENNVTPKRDVR
jgi:ankyrin repeat protein